LVHTRYIYSHSHTALSLRSRSTLALLLLLSFSRWLVLFVLSPVSMTTLKDKDTTTLTPSMRDLSKLTENSLCADCDTKDPDWASINLGIFICIKCAGVHRNLGVQHSKVRSIDLDTTCWDLEQIEFMKKIGNVKAKYVYEFNAPSYYIRASETESSIVRENWIRAKYVRKEFVKSDDETKNLSSTEFRLPEKVKEGFLTKTNRKNVWQKRWFVLLGRYLYYFKSQDAPTPKGHIDVRGVNVRVPESPETAHKYSFEIVTPKRCYPLRAEKDDEMFSWLHALRRASRFYKEQKDNHEETKERPADLESPHGKIGRQLLSAYLTQLGFNLFGSWTKKWCVLVPNSIYIFKKEPLDVDLPEAGISFDNTMCDVTDCSDKAKKRCCFAVVKPGRIHYFQTSTEQENKAWIQAISEIVEKNTTRTPFDFRIKFDQNGRVLEQPNGL